MITANKSLRHFACGSYFMFSAFLNMVQTLI